MPGALPRCTISVIADQSWKGGDVTMFVIDDLPWSAVKLSKPFG